MESKTLLYFGRHGAKPEFTAPIAGSRQDTITQESLENLRKRGFEMGKKIKHVNPLVVFIHSPFKRTLETTQAIAVGLQEAGVQKIVFKQSTLGDVDLNTVESNRLMQRARAKTKTEQDEEATREMQRWLNGKGTVMRETREQLEQRAAPLVLQTIRAAMKRAAKRKPTVIITINHLAASDLLHHHLRTRAGLKWTQRYSLREESGFWLEANDKGLFYLGENLDAQGRLVYTKKQLSGQYKKHGLEKNYGKHLTDAELHELVNKGIQQTGLSSSKHWSYNGNKIDGKSFGLLHALVRKRKKNGKTFFGTGNWEKYLEKFHGVVPFDQHHWSDERLHGTIALLVKKRGATGWSQDNEAAIHGRSPHALFMLALQSNKRRKKVKPFFSKGNWRSYVKWTVKKYGEAK